MEEVSTKVEKFEWIRRNTEVTENKKKRQMDEEDANNLGMEV